MNEETLEFSRRKLPHWIVANKSYFVTLRVKGSLPKNVVVELQQLENIGLEGVELQRRKFKLIESYLDNSNPVASLTDERISNIIFDNVKWFEIRGWVIHAATVMSTHIHLLISNSEGKTAELLNHLSQFKRFTAREVNKVLNRSGHFWAREDFDHWIRSPEKFVSVVKYIAKNPVKSGLVKEWQDWKWTIVDERLISVLET